MTGVLMWIVRGLIVLMIVRLVVRFFSGRRAAPRRRSQVPERAGGTLVRDPHCGTYVPESRALTVGSGPRAVHFCSVECRDAWAATHARRRAKA